MPVRSALVRVALAAAFVVPAISLGGPTAPPQPNLVSIYNGPGAQVTGKRNIAVLVHGYTSDPTLWSDNFRTSLVNRLTALGTINDWDIWAVDWRENAAGNTAAPPTSAEDQAMMEGQFVARTIIDQINAGGGGGGYRHVHLFGHSLGGRVVESAATVLRQARVNTDGGGGHATIHSTFLDAYTPHDWEYAYGRTATWAEHYYEVDGLLPNTQDDIPAARNVDVTALRPPIPPNTPFADERTIRHAWPHVFYRNTIDNFNAMNPPHAGYGFPLSRERDPNNWPRAGHPIGQRITIAANNTTTVAVVPPVDPYQVVAIDPSGEGVVCGTSGDNVTIAGGIIEMLSGSGLGAWANLNVNVPRSDSDFFQFQFEFVSPGPAMGLLSLFMDDSIQYAAREQFVTLPGFQDSGMINYNGFFNLAPGIHKMSFRLDLPDDSTSIVRIRQPSLGLIPAPSVVVLLALTVPAAARRRRTPV